MLKRTLKYFILTLLIFGGVFVYLIYFGQNGLSLSLNLGTSLPGDLTVLEMDGRRTLRPFDIFDETFTARCQTSKTSLKKWLQTKDFEVIYYGIDTVTDEHKFVHNFASLPNEILKNNIGYGIQLSRKIADSPQIIVTPLDKDNVLLDINFGWN